MGKYPIRLIGTPVVPGDLDYDMDPPEWHTPWFEADALDADGHHHRVYWPIPSKTNEWLVGDLLTVDDPDFGDVCDWLHPSLILCYEDALSPDSSAVDVTAQVSEVVVDAGVIPMGHGRVDLHGQHIVPVPRRGVYDPELACCIGDNYFDHSIRHLDHLYLYEAVNDTYFTATEDDRVISVMSEAQAKEWARDQLYPRDYDALCDGLWWCPV